MTEVYVITSGSYDDYRIVTVFSTKEKAEEFLGVFPDTEARLEVWKLDPDIRKDYHYVYLAMQRSGVTEFVDLYKDDEVELRQPFFNLVKRFEGHQVLVHMAYGTSDKEAAIKSCDERRLQLIESGEWP